MNSSLGGSMYYSSEDMLPYRCPSCGSSKRFRSLVALRMHMSIIHDISTGNNGNLTNESTDLLEKSETEGPERVKVGTIEDVPSSNAVDAIFNKYSGRMDNILGKYDSKTKQIANRIKMAKQLEQIKQQKRDLNMIRTNWETVHGLSQLVEETDMLINSRPDKSSPNPPLHSTSNLSPQSSLPQPHTSSHAPQDDYLLRRQVDAGVALAAKYKTLAIEAEHKLQEKIEEEHHMKQFIQVVANKERHAKKKLSELLEEILERAETAEQQLESYRGPSSTRNHHQLPRRSSLPGKSNTKSQHSNNRRHKQRERSKTSAGSINYTPRSIDSGIASPHHANNSNTQSTLNNSGDRTSPVDPFILSVLEPPSSQELKRKWPPRGGDKEQLYGVDTSHLVDGMSLFPFSNRITNNKKAQSSSFASDRRVVLFCIFSRMRNVDLLSMALVCREWRDVARHSQLWSRIRFDNLRMEGKLLKRISEWSSETCYLHLHNISLLPSNMDAPDTETGCLEEGLEMILKRCGDKLLVLAIDRCDPVITSRVMWLVSCYNRKIRNIVYRSSIDPLCHQVGWSLGSACRDIVSLEVAPVQPCPVPGMFDNNVARLLSWCWPQLQALSFGGINIDGAGLISVALNCPHIKVLELDHAKGISQDSAITACKHGLRDLHSLLFTHTPVQAVTLNVFLSSCAHLQFLHVVVAQRDFYPRKSKMSKVQAEYIKIVKALKDLEQDPKHGHVVHVECD
uniref:F-box only protein 41 n=1 Tax=Ciona intestinalis TaxID=7719 RepID=UPI00089DC515|nr:F-box only protein 41 [Ciona intestinalis]|eukprot:XP_018666908.1 F-box only protein 41 [Ciona intestinalis]